MRVSSGQAAPPYQGDQLEGDEVSAVLVVAAQVEIESKFKSVS